MGNIYALIINPKGSELHFASQHSPGGKSMLIYELGRSDRDVGEGYFHSAKNDDYAESFHVTGFPRVHTPEGVERSRIGTGLGTVLYTALCVAAHQEKEREMKSTRSTLMT